MPRRIAEDFDIENPPWLIDGWLPLGHKGMDTAPEGSFKTILGCWLAVCIAAGVPVFGMETYQGPAVIVDEETPPASLKFHLDRFAKGLGFRFQDLPLYVFSMEGYRFGRANMKDLANTIKMINPRFVRLDSMLAMLPSGRERLSETSDKLGEIIRDNLNDIISEERSVMLAAHAKKFVSELSMIDIKSYGMNSLIRGHNSIIGEGCDTGYILSKISNYPNPTRFYVATEARRTALPNGTSLYIELQEQAYGDGWAQLVSIPPEKLPPSEVEFEIYKIFKASADNGNPTHSTQQIRKTCALYTMKECRSGLSELLRRNAVVEAAPQVYEINGNRDIECDPDYLKMLEIKKSRLTSTQYRLRES